MPRTVGGKLHIFLKVKRDFCEKLFGKITQMMMAGGPVYA